MAQIKNNARAMIGFANGRTDPTGPKIKDVGMLRRYYRDDGGLRTQAVPQMRPDFMKPRYG